MINEKNHIWLSDIKYLLAFENLNIFCDFRFFFTWHNFFLVLTENTYSQSKVKKIEIDRNREREREREREKVRKSKYKNVEPKIFERPY